MTDWDFAANIPEVKPLVSFTPPPVPQIAEQSEDSNGEEAENADDESIE